MKVFAIGMFQNKTLIGDLIQDWSPVSRWKQKPFREFCMLAFRETLPSKDRHVTMVEVAVAGQKFLFAMCHNPHSDQSPASKGNEIDKIQNLNDKIEKLKTPPFRLSVLVSEDYPRSALTMLLLSGYMKLRQCDATSKTAHSRNYELKKLWLDLCSPHTRAPEALTIDRVKSNLEDTKTIMFEVIDKVLERGTKVEHLVERSDDLSKMSKLFYRRTRKMNSKCCLIQ